MPTGSQSNIEVDLIVKAISEGFEKVSANMGTLATAEQKLTTASDQSAKSSLNMARAVNGAFSIIPALSKNVSFFGNNIGTTIGGKYALRPEQTLFGVYELAYDGPGMRAQEGHEFQERSIDHSVSAGHSWKLSPRYTLNSRFQYVHEFRRTGANEQFGNGLYDYWSLGLAERLDLGLVPGTPLGAGLSYAYVRFPNYTDLMSEFQSA